VSFSFSGEVSRVAHHAAALEPSEDAVRRTDSSTEAVTTVEEHHGGHMKVVPLSEAREGRGCEKSVFVSDVNNRTEPRSSEQDLAEVAHQPLNVRLHSDLDPASTERALPQDSSIIPVSRAQNSCGSVAHAHNSCGSVAHAHNSCSSEASAQNSCDSVAHAQNSCNPSTTHAPDSCSSKARTPERHFSASSCSSSSSISGRGRQGPVTRPASLSEVMSGMDTNLSPRPNWDPPLSLPQACPSFFEFSTRCL
jgi:hypothetical protein